MEVNLEQLGQQPRSAPAVENGVVQANAELKFPLAPAVYVKARQRRGGPVEARALLRASPVADLLLLFSWRKLAQVVEAHWRLDCFMDQLQRLAEVAEVERRTQHRMTRDERGERGTHALRVERRFQVQAANVMISRGVLAVLAVEEHAE